ncbi:MAG: hypothetical protein WCN98_03340 [Verrucomicrobiaceae bacterium]
MKHFAVQSPATERFSPVRLSNRISQDPIMRRETFVFLSIILLTVARAADVAVTYRFSPDLAFEGNPMVKLFGMGWTFMLCANLIAVSALGVCSVYFLRNPIRYESSAVVNDVWSFASFASFNRVYSRKMFLCKRFFCTPKRGKHTLHLFTVVAPLS